MVELQERVDRYLSMLMQVEDQFARICMAPVKTPLGGGRLLVFDGEALFIEKKTKHGVLTLDPFRWDEEDGLDGCLFDVTAAALSKMELLIESDARQDPAAMQAAADELNAYLGQEL